MSVVLEAKNVCFSYGDFSLKDINLSIESGSICGLLGQNGSGKSTFLNCCMGFLQKSSGEIYINSENIDNKSSSWIAKNIAYVAQNLDMSFAFSVKEVVSMGRSPHITSVFGLNRLDRQIVYESMEFMGILNLADKKITELSGGQRQLVFMARALAQQTPIMLLDEPTSALDFKNQIMLYKMLKAISNEGKTIVICTHDINHVLWFCSHVVAFLDGRVLASADTKSVINDEFLDIVYSGSCKLEKAKELDIVLPNL